MGTFRFWFRPDAAGINTSWDIFDLKMDRTKIIGTVNSKSNSIEYSLKEYATEEFEKDILNDFYMFKNMRPEYSIEELMNGTTYTVDTMYEKLLAGSILMSNSLNNVELDSKLAERAVRCLKWLRGTDFFYAPASTKFHGSIHSGLVTHSIDVAYNILQLSKLPKFSNVNIYEAVMVALIHDWCKINRYEAYFKNVKNEETGIWEQVQAFRWKETDLPFGHGEASMFMAQRMLHISVSQALAIRWHMGWTRVHQQDMNDLQHANETVPLVHMLQFADQLSIVEY